MNRRSNGFAVTAGQAVGLLLAAQLMAPFVVTSAEPPAPANPSAAPLVVFLDPQALNAPFCRRDSSLYEMVTFTKEPKFSGGTVVRSKLWAGNDTNSTVPYAWDRRAGRLYIDQNRNRDLTDDPAGVFTVGPGDSVTNVQVWLPTPAGPRPLILDLQFMNLGAGDPTYGRLRATLRSCWEGRLASPGRDWQVVVIDGFDRGNPGEPSLLALCPWEERNRPPSLEGAYPDALAFPRRIFWQGQAFGVGWSVTNEAGRARARLELKPESVPLGELRVTGNLLRRVVLTGKPFDTVLLDTTGGVFRIPAGDYTVQRTWVKSGAAEACETSGRPITVREGGTTNLAAGGPLTNSVVLNRRGRDLVVRHRLVGLEGAEFHLAGQSETNPPQFTIFKAGQPVASGKFEFG